jgi:protein disulfide-isomerase A6
LIAKVDAEAENAKATAKEHDVTSYPTIKYFPKGSTTPVSYDGARSEADFVTFLNKNAGTHRVVGGGLDSEAGTIEVLDAIVLKFVGGEALATASKDISNAAQGLKDKYAQYYVKVFDKLNKNSGYIKKELARLDGLVKKGGLAPEKIDDLISRSNILRKFLGSGAKDEL